MGHGERAVEWPFDEDCFSGYDAGFHGEKMSVDADAADYKVDFWVICKFCIILIQTALHGLRRGNMPSGRE